MKKLKNNYWFLSILAALLLWIAWPPYATAPLIFIGFVPLFYLQNLAQQNREKNRVYWFYTFNSLLIWNVLTTWWVWYASPAAIAAFVLNAVMMSLPWLAFHFTRKTFGNKIAYPAFVFYWLGFEFWHLNWQASWPWLTLGNVFASLPNMVQWYEYTGFLGGSLWVLVVNILVYKLPTAYKRARTLVLAAVIIIPITVSYIIVNTLDTTGDKTLAVNTSVIQPNIDPYTEKFSDGSKFITPQEQLQRMLTLAEKSITPETRLVVFPETSITEQMNEDEFSSDSSVLQIREFCRKHKVSVLSGADTYYIFKMGEKITSTARKHGDLHYDVYNTALLIDSTNKVQVYHKCKLVPGVEVLPFPRVFAPIEKLFDLGGTSGSLGVQGDAEIFTTQDNLKLAPIICYESVYGDWVGRYVRKGADLLCIITNDGWWRDTPGYRQHLQYGRLRAIETRRNIARAANTGISAFINYKGEIEEETGWWVPAELNQTTYLKKGMTFYTRTGDYIGIAGAIAAVLTLLATFGRMIFRKK